MIKFLDLQAINLQYQSEIEERLLKVFRSGWYLQGEENKNFEENLKKYIGAPYAIGVANGLDALRLILKAYIELGHMHEGDEVIVPANTYIASILAITDNRLVPVLVEPDINSYNIDIAKIEEKITPRTKAIMIVHLYGQVCWSEELDMLAKKHNLKIIEDNAQAFLLIRNSKKNEEFLGCSCSHETTKKEQEQKNKKEQILMGFIAGLTPCPSVFAPVIISLGSPSFSQVFLYVLSYMMGIIVVFVALYLLFFFLKGKALKPFMSLTKSFNPHIISGALLIAIGIFYLFLYYYSHLEHGHVY